MAFTKTNLRVLEDGTIGALATGKLWKYNVPTTSGTPDTVTTAGYFDAKCGLSAGDIVLAITTALTFYVISESSGVLTATAIKIAAASLPE